MIIIAYLLTTKTDEYTGSKSESSPFCLEDVAFRCGHRLFAETAPDEDIQYSMFITLMFMSQKNGAMGYNIRDKASEKPLL